MKGRNVVVINGRHYDAITGVPVSQSTLSAPTAVKPAGRPRTFHDIGPGPSKQPALQAASAPTPAAPASRGGHTARTVHKKPQRSTTLHRAATKRPVTYAIQATHSSARSPLITKFGPNNAFIKPAQTAPAEQPVALNDSYVRNTQGALKPVLTPAKHVKAPATLKHAAAAASSRQLKEQLIKEKLAEVKPQHAKSKTRTNPIKKLAKKQPKLVSIATMSVALIALGGYLTYVNMPNLSVRVASAHAGIDARFPEYRPDGYSFAGPVAYAPGEVTIKFSSNGGSGGYQVKQRASNWDSQAVLDNYVTRESNSYLTYSEQGLTVYTFGNKAAWVNGGVLYTIDGDAPLSSEQILRIAASM